MQARLFDGGGSPLSNRYMPRPTPLAPHKLGKCAAILLLAALVVAAVGSVGHIHPYKSAAQAHDHCKLCDLAAGLIAIEGPDAEAAVIPAVFPVEGDYTPLWRSQSPKHTIEIRPPPVLALS